MKMFIRYLLTAMAYPSDIILEPDNMAPIAKMTSQPQDEAKEPAMESVQSPIVDGPILAVSKRLEVLSSEFEKLNEKINAVIPELEDEMHSYEMDTNLVDPYLDERDFIVPKYVPSLETLAYGILKRFGKPLTVDTILREVHSNKDLGFVSRATLIDVLVNSVFFQTDAKHELFDLKNLDFQVLEAANVLVHILEDARQPLSKSQLLNEAKKYNEPSEELLELGLTHDARIIKLEDQKYSLRDRQELNQSAARSS
jgi:DNA-directed RNA polymerase delta subunit